MSNKKEYIERGALSKFVRDVRRKLPKDSKDFFTRDEMLLNFQQYVDAQPAADVEPVVRGEWLEHEDECECPACGETWNYCDNDTERFDCCPKCGARLVAHMEMSGSGE